MQNYSSSDIDTSDKTDELMCDLQRTASSNMFSELDYSENSRRLLSTETQDHSRSLQGGGSGTPSVVAGIFITGAPIFNALDADAQDPFYPGSGSSEISTTD